MAEKHALIPDPITMYTQKDSMKEVKDISRNLMSGDFERQYRGPAMEKCDRKHKTWLVTAAATVTGLLVVLLVLVVVREVQISRLRCEVDELTANMIAISATVKSLNQKINNKHNDFKPLDDTIYTDEDQDDAILEDDGKDILKDKSNYDSLKKLRKVTVEEDNIGDDEDMLDNVDDDAESGDWYADYDRRAEKIGTSSMVRLTSDDFTDTVLPFTDDLRSNVGEIKRLLNENPENPDLPALQTVLRPALSTSTEKRSSSTPEPSTESSDEKRSKRSVFPESSAEELYRTPRLVAKTDDRRKTKKFLGNIDSASVAKMTMHTAARTVRNSDSEEHRRPFIAAHFHGNTSHLRTETDEHYKGNGLVRMAHGAHHNVWYPAPWTLASPHPRPTLTQAGHVRVHHTGVYLVYAQIYYFDSHDTISWVLHRTNPEIEGRDTLLQCAQSAHSAEPLEKPNSCYSAAALFLRAGDRLAIRNTGGNIHSIMEPEKSFVGLIKLADAEDPIQDL